MPRIAPVPPTDVSPEIKAIFDEIEKGFGKVPNLFLTMAHHPPLLKANWEKMKLVMMGAYESGQIEAEDLVQTAIDQGRLSPDALDDAGYVNAVKYQLQDLRDRDNNGLNN